MKLKTLEKKVRRLEARLKEGPKKLAKLKRKLAAMVAARQRKAQKKAAARAVARQTVKPLKPITAKAATAKSASAANKVKRRLNLSPERRAQLSAAMKARWAAKRAAAAESAPPNRPAGEGSAPG